MPNLPERSIEPKSYLGTFEKKQEIFSSIYAATTEQIIPTNKKHTIKVHRKLVEAKNKKEMILIITFLILPRK